MNSPCMNCPERHKLCHSECDKYAAFAAENARILANREKRCDERSFIIESRKNVATMWYHGRKVKKRKGRFGV